MKRLFFAILALAVLLSACSTPNLLVTTETAETAETAATAPTETAGVHDPTGFAAGFGRADITPETPVPLAGYGATSLRIFASESQAESANPRKSFLRCPSLRWAS